MPGPIPHQRSPEADRFEALFRGSVASVRRFAVHLVGPDLADDVVEDAFAVVWRRWDRMPESDDEQRAWLFGVARRSAQAVARRDRMWRRHGHVTTLEPVQADHADSVAGRDRVHRLLATLPPKEGEAVFLTVWVGLTPEQAAGAVGCSTAALRKRLARARAHLEGALAVEAQAGREVERVDD